MRAKNFDRENGKIDLTFKLLEISGSDKNRQAHAITAEFYLMEEGSKPDNPSNSFLGSTLIKWKDSTQPKNLNTSTPHTTNLLNCPSPPTTHITYSVKFLSKAARRQSLTPKTTPISPISQMMSKV